LTHVATLPATSSGRGKIMRIDIAPGAIFVDDEDFHPSLRAA
jgi:hypothetical protein